MSSKSDTLLFLSRPFLTKKQILKAQSNNIQDHRAYNQKKLAIIKFLSDICVQLRFPRKTLEAALYFYQRFYLFNKFETELCYTIATSAILLSCKQVETIKKSNEICSISLRLRSVAKVTPEILDNFKKRVCQHELRLLEAISFDYRINNYVHIDEYVIKLGKELAFSQETCYLAWIIAYDVLKTEIILVVPQHTISLAVLKIAHELPNAKSTWPTIRYTTFESDEKSFSEAYFDLLNFYINSFDLCDLKDNMPSGLQSISIDTFIELKKRAGREYGLKNPTDKEVDTDLYLSTQYDTSNVRERRYVLSAKSINSEVASMNQKP
ncbi:hypothetical protein HG535_0A04990 [Zygotorulaspora mrakii]|uniref:Cyclin-like domain-containing protein n=1 Tax=Zygotorulaspora mrakii TaxID=42260 RepID=A0A7H9AVZ7_ZYGMR|nr:uncharacterized protein HG535_0A04990 [Zygotorulaspora mrakii]QLG70558.1 hypothetical protein HG535_0A04990 [Zygotorulaspora mrakii]